MLPSTWDDSIRGGDSWINSVAARACAQDLRERFAFALEAIGRQRLTDVSTTGALPGVARLRVPTGPAIMLKAELISIFTGCEPMQADLVEVFSSFQGEGLYVGQRQLFVRFAGCNLRCHYCDTEGAQGAPDTCRFEKHPGRRDFNTCPIPVSESRLLDATQHLQGHEAVSLTGGEPLMQAGFIASIAPRLASLGSQVHLETNGVLHRELETVIGCVDVVAMDIKLPSATGQPPRFDDNRAFLAAAARREVFVKLVVCAATTADEVSQAAGVVADGTWITKDDLPEIGEYHALIIAIDRYGRDEEIREWRLAVEQCPAVADESLWSLFRDLFAEHHDTQRWALNKVVSEDVLGGFRRARDE